jgi:hypothetical protein
MPIAAPYRGGLRLGSLVLLVGLGASSSSRVGPAEPLADIELAGIPLAVTYSPLSGSSMVFDRRAVGGLDLAVAD